MPAKKTVKTRKIKVRNENGIDEIREEIIDTGKDVDDIKEEVIDSGKDIDHIKEEVFDSGKDIDDIKEDVEDIRKKQNSLIKKLSQSLIPKDFSIHDVAQQIVGAIILSTPFAVTEEVWALAQAIDLGRLAMIFAITVIFDILLIYFTKFQNINIKKKGQVVARVFSLLIISYSAATIMLYTFGVLGGQVAWEQTIKLVIFVGLFANIGAGTADILR
jgi:uncharacterized membrane protein